MLRKQPFLSLANKTPIKTNKRYYVPDRSGSPATPNLISHPGRRLHFFLSLPCKTLFGRSISKWMLDDPINRPFIPELLQEVKGRNP